MLTTKTNHAVILVLAAELVSFVAYGGFFVLNLWLALTIAGAAGVSAVLLANVLPSVLLAPFVGAIVDRHNRARIAAISNFCRGALFSITSILVTLNYTSLNLLLCVSFAMGVGELFYSSSRRALLQELSGSSGIVRLMPKLVVASQVGTLTGTVSAGLVATNTSYALQFASLAGCFLVSSCLLAPLTSLNLSIGLTAPNPPARTWTNIVVGYFDDVRSGMKYASGRGLLYIFLFPMLLLIYLRLITAGLAPFIRDTLQGASFEYGIVDSAFAVGAIAGAAILARIMLKLSFHGAMIWGFIILGTSTYIFQHTSSVLTAMLLHAIMGVGYQVSTAFHIVAQERTRTEYQGRTASLFSFFAGVLSISVYAWGSAAGIATGSPPFYTIGASVCLVAACVLLVRPVVRSDTHAVETR